MHFDSKIVYWGKFCHSPLCHEEFASKDFRIPNENLPLRFWSPLLNFYSHAQPTTYVRMGSSRDCRSPFAHSGMYRKFGEGEITRILLPRLSSAGIRRNGRFRTVLQLGRKDKINFGSNHFTALHLSSYFRLRFADFPVLCKTGKREFFPIETGKNRENPGNMF